MMSRLLVFTVLTVPLLLGACREGLDTGRVAELRELCATYCPERVACVDDNFFAGDVDKCVERCEDEERFLEDNACGEASFAALACLAGLACAELPAAVDAVARADEGAGCRAELLAQQERCDFRPRY